MPAEPKTARKPRKSSNVATETAADDHRKRRRNRTTQSCLNCHSSKRMCDRGRPCSRCRQLGLTGLCVYEVDDPTQRGDPLDESLRLTQRVAELEGVIRELKNKPHPRWTQAGTSPELDKWHTRARTASDTDNSDSNGSNASSSPRLPIARQVDASSTDLTVTNSTLEKSLSISPLPLAFSSPGPPPTPPDSTASNSPASYGAYYPTASSLDELSPGVLTPADERPETAAGLSQYALPPDFDFSSIFPPFFLSGDGPSSDPAANSQESAICVPGHQADRIMMQQVLRYDGEHCGCLHDHSNYSGMLELALHLRKAVDTLSRSSNHRMGMKCKLNQRVNELDVYSTSVLGSAPSPPEPLGLPLTSSAHPTSHLQGGRHISVFPTSHRHPPSMSTIVPGQWAVDSRHWDSLQPSATGSATPDEGFMSWRGPNNV